MTSAMDRTAPTLADVRASFARFADGYAALPLYRAICVGAAGDDEVAGLLLSARPGQARPVLFLAALHDLVLQRPGLPAAPWYSSIVGHGNLPEGDPWADVRRTILDHRVELREVIATHDTQTNEVGRAVLLGVGLALASSDVPDVPVVLVEQGSSAGLLLGVDRYRVEVLAPGRQLILGDPDSPVRCQSIDRSTPPITDVALPRLAARIGLDLHPVALDDPDAIRWLEACLWPDVPGRVERFRAALTVLRCDPPEVRRGDMIVDLAATIQAALGGLDPADRDGHLVVYSSWALTYVERRRRPAIAEILEQVAQDRPVTWLTAEPTGCVPGLTVPPVLAARRSETVLGARRWRGGVEVERTVWGTCPHGEWIDLSPFDAR